MRLIKEKQGTSFFNFFLNFLFYVEIYFQNTKSINIKRSSFLIGNKFMIILLQCFISGDFWFLNGDFFLFLRLRNLFFIQGGRKNVLWNVMLRDLLKHSRTFFFAKFFTEGLDKRLKIGWCFKSLSWSFKVMIIIMVDENFFIAATFW